MVGCGSYQEKEVFHSIERGFELLGGVDSLFTQNEKVLLKPNMLLAKRPEEAATTHPSILGAVADLLKGKVGSIRYGDSPGFGSQERVGKVSGLLDMAERKNIPMVDFSNGKSVPFHEGHVTKRFDIGHGVLESDALISLPKMKTHQLTRITGAIKNQLGCVYGLNKPAFHTRFPDGVSFSKMLVDLNMFLKPRVFILDGVVAMEGNGPSSGTPKKMNVILLSQDPVALDATFARLVDLDPEYVPTITWGAEAGLGRYRDVELVGDPFEEFFHPEFDVIRKPVKVEKPGRYLPFLRNLALRKPVIDPDRCISCGVCVETCPAKEKALAFQDRSQPPEYDYGKCIRCYCCQEMCPEDAIEVVTPFLGKLLLYR